MNSAKESEMKGRIKEDGEEGFRDFMEKPETKLVLSLIPPSENPDAIQTLLKAAFNAGVAVGQGIILKEMIGAMLKEKG